MNVYERNICELIWNFRLWNNECDSSHDFSSQLSSLLYELKREWKYAIFIGDMDKKVKLEEYLCNLFCLIGYSRDIFSCGERDLSYRMIYTWYSVFPILSIYALHSFFLEDNGNLPYGGWKDFKYFCREVSTISIHGKSDPLIDTCISIVNHQIDLELCMIRDFGLSDPCLPKEALPKETGAYSWLFDRLVLHRDPIMGHKGFSKKQFRLDIASIYNFSCNLPVSSSQVEWREMEEPSLSSGSILEKDIIGGGHMKCIGDSYRGCHKGYYDKVFIGAYIRGILFDPLLSSNWILKWWKLVRSFSGINAIPIIVLSVDITDEILYNMIGYACLLSCIHGSCKRILILSTIPIWLDVTQNCYNIVELASQLWSYCKNRRTRVYWSDLLLDDMSSSYDVNMSNPVQLVFFGSWFDFDYMNRLRELSSSMV